MWSIRIVMGGALLAVAMASACAQPARTDAGGEPLSLLEINQRPIVESAPVVAGEPAQKTSAKPKSGIAATHAQPASPGNTTPARPEAAATRTVSGRPRNAAVTRGTVSPAAYADAPNITTALPLASPQALDLSAGVRNAPAQFVPPSPIALSETVTTATAPTPAPQPGVPTMVAEPEPRAASRQGAGTPWLLLGTLGGGVVGAAIVWLIVGSRTARAGPMPRREEKADQAVRHQPAFAYDNRRSDPPLGARDNEESTQPRGYDLASTYDNRRDDRASASAERQPYSREWQNVGRPSRHDRASAYDRRRDDSGEWETADPRGGDNQASAHDDRWPDSGVRKRTELPWVASAHDAVSHALEEIEEADKAIGRNAASAHDAIRDAPPHSATPVEPNPLYELGTTLPLTTQTRRSNTDKMLYVSLEQEITSLLGRPIGQSPRREEAHEPSGRKAAPASDDVRDSRSRWETPAGPNPFDGLGAAAPRETRQRKSGNTLYDDLEQEAAALSRRPGGRNSQREGGETPRGRNAASAYESVSRARPRLERLAEPDPFDELGAAVPRSVKARQSSAEKRFFDSLEEEITSLLGRRTNKNSQMGEFDQPRGRKATSVFDAVRDALRERREADEPSGYNAASVYDTVHDASGEWSEADQPSGFNTASAYDAVRDALSESEEADQPSGADSIHGGGLGARKVDDLII